MEDKDYFPPLFIRQAINFRPLVNRRELPRIICSRNREGRRALETINSIYLLFCSLKSSFQRSFFRRTCKTKNIFTIFSLKSQTLFKLTFSSKSEFSANSSLLLASLLSKTNNIHIFIKYFYISVCYVGITFFIQ